MDNETAAKTVLDSHFQEEDGLILQNKTISGSPLFEWQLKSNLSKMALGLPVWLGKFGKFDDFFSRVYSLVL